MSDEQTFNVIRKVPVGNDVSVTYDMPITLAFAMLVLDSVKHPDCGYEVRRQYKHAGTHKYYSVKPGWLTNGEIVYDEVERCEVRAQEIPEYHRKVHGGW